MKLSQLALAAALGIAHASAALAGDTHGHEHDHSAPAQADAATGAGEVKKVDKEAGKITIKHGPLRSLGMPGMTMAFGVKDAAMLDQVKAGDKIRFAAEQRGAAYVVTQLETVR